VKKLSMMIALRSRSRSQSFCVREHDWMINLSSYSEVRSSGKRERRDEGRQGEEDPAERMKMTTMMKKIDEDVNEDPFPKEPAL